MLISRQNIREKYFFFLPKNKIFDSRAGHKWSVSSANESFPLQSIPWLSQIHHFVPPPVSVGQQQFPHPFPQVGCQCLIWTAEAQVLCPHLWIVLFLQSWQPVWALASFLLNVIENGGDNTLSMLLMGFFYSKNQEFEYLIRNACHLFRTLTKTLTFVH